MIEFLAGMGTGFLIWFLVCCLIKKSKTKTNQPRKRKKDPADWWKNGGPCPY